MLEEEGIEAVAESNKPTPVDRRMILSAEPGEAEEEGEVTESEKGVGLDIAEAVRVSQTYYKTVA